MDFLKISENAYGLCQDGKLLSLRLSCPKNDQIVEIPAGITEIGNNAMEDRNVVFSDNDAFKKLIASVKIPEGVTSIGAEAFAWCENLREVILPQSLESIGAYAFQYCKSLKSIVLPSNLKKIGKNVFYKCSLLESVVISEGITALPPGIFANCIMLRSITFPDSIKKIGAEAFAFCNRLESVKLPHGITSIGTGVFRRCTALETICIPDGVLSIGASAFDGCSALTSMTLPESVKTIKEYAFFDCRSLRKMIVSAYSITIGAYAFGNCFFLSELVIPVEKTVMDENAFSGCSGLLWTQENGLKYVGVAENPYLYLEGPIDKDIKKCDGINSRTRVIGTGFENCVNLEAICIPEGVQRIVQMAFKECRSLKEISLPESITYIGDGTFEGCESLTRLEIPYGIEHLDMCIREHIKVIPPKDYFFAKRNISDSVLCSFLFNYWHKWMTPRDWAMVYLFNNSSKLVEMIDRQNEGCDYGEARRARREGAPVRMNDDPNLYAVEMLDLLENGGNKKHYKIACEYFEKHVDSIKDEYKKKLKKLSKSIK